MMWETCDQVLNFAKNSAVMLPDTIIIQRGKNTLIKFNNLNL